MSLAKSLRGILPAVRMTTDADFALWATSILLPNNLTNITKKLYIFLLKFTFSLKKFTLYCFC